MVGINKAKFAVVNSVVAAPFIVCSGQQELLHEKFCGPVFSPILLTPCFYQDALQWALLPRSGQSGPLGNSLC